MTLAIGNHRLPVSDEGWPYPDLEGGPPTPDEIDLDALELRIHPHVYLELSPIEREVLFGRFGLGGEPVRTIKEIAQHHGLSHAEARDALGCAIHKLRHALA